MKITAILLVSGLVFAPASATVAQVPYTFTPGAPAKAAEVNANFASVDARMEATGARADATDARLETMDARIGDAEALLAALAARLVPVGTVVAFAGTTAPDGWLPCDGAAVSRTTYAELFAVLGVSHGHGDQASTFNLPDYRGRFLRGADSGAGRDPDVASRAPMASGGASGVAVGSVQGHQLTAHNHALTDPGHAHGFYGDVTGGWNPGNPKFDSDRRSTLNWTTAATTGISIAATGGNETRPVNAYVGFIIKY